VDCSGSKAKVDAACVGRFSYVHCCHHCVGYNPPADGARRTRALRVRHCPFSHNRHAADRARGGGGRRGPVGDSGGGGRKPRCRRRHRGRTHQRRHVRYDTRVRCRCVLLVRVVGRVGRWLAMENRLDTSCQLSLL